MSAPCSRRNPGVVAGADGRWPPGSPRRGRYSPPRPNGHSGTMVCPPGPQSIAAATSLPPRPWPPVFSGHGVWIRTSGFPVGPVPEFAQVAVGMEFKAGFGMVLSDLRDIVYADHHRPRRFHV
jgi:hypothetical protein